MFCHIDLKIPKGLASESRECELHSRLACSLEPCLFSEICTLCLPLMFSKQLVVFLAFIFVLLSYFYVKIFFIKIFRINYICRPNPKSTFHLFLTFLQKRINCSRKILDAYTGPNCNRLTLSLTCQCVTDSRYAKKQWCLKFSVVYLFTKD